MSIPKLGDTKVKFWLLVFKYGNNLGYFDTKKIPSQKIANVFLL